jgi:acetate kinase
MAAMGGVHALVFTAGIGENSSKVRALVCAGMEDLGIMLDPERNIALNRTKGEIHHPASRVRILIVPTNEELQIARETMETLCNTLNPQIFLSCDSEFTCILVSGI